MFQCAVAVPALLLAPVTFFPEVRPTVRLFSWFLCCRQTVYCFHTYFPGCQGHCCHTYFPGCQGYCFHTYFPGCQGLCCRTYFPGCQGSCFRCTFQLLCWLLLHMSFTHYFFFCILLLGPSAVSLCACTSASTNVPLHHCSSTLRSSVPCDADVLYSADGASNCVPSPFSDRKLAQSSAPGSRCMGNAKSLLCPYWRVATSMLKKSPLSTTD